MSIELEIENIVDSILEDYQKERNIDKMDILSKVDKEVIIDIIDKLVKIIYPGFSHDKQYHIYTAHHRLSMMIEDVMYNLNQQLQIIYRSTNVENAEELAMQNSLAFFKEIPNIRAMLACDAEAFYNGDPAAYSVEEIIFCYPGLYAITVYRLAHILYELNVPIIPRIMSEHAHSITGIDINPGAKIAKNFFIDHGTGIVIGETCVIGENVKIYQGVTLGALTTRGGQSLKNVRRHPTIEDNVVIYAGASILGGETVIGANSVIGSNVFITKSIEPCTTVSVKNQELHFKQRSGCKECHQEMFDEIKTK